MSTAITDFELRLQRFYTQAAEQGEVSPAQRYRLEGFAQALLALGLAERDQLLACVRRNYRDASGAALEDACGPGWSGQDPDVVPVPWTAPRAPVWPSTRE